MADGIIRRFVRVIFDRSSAQKAEQELVQGMGAAGKKSGDSFVRNLKASFAAEMAGLKVLLARGIIDEKEFKKRADVVAKTFNKGIVEGMQKAKAAGTLTDKEFIKLSNTLKRTGDQGFSAGGRIQSAFARLGATLAAAFTIQKGIQFFREAITEALEAEQSVQRLDSALKPLGLTYKQVGQQAEVLLDRIQETTRFSDEDAREALTALVTGTGDYARSLELLEVTAKIAEKRQITMTDAAQVALKANQGLTRGMHDLGIGAGETGDIIAKINQNLGDLAVEGGRTSEGMLKRANNLWKEFQENIGAAVLGSEAFTEAGGSVIDTLKDLNKWAIENKKSIGEAATAVANLVAWLTKLSLQVFQAGDDMPGWIARALGFGPKKDPLSRGGMPIPVPGPAGQAAPGTAPTGSATRGTPTGRAGKKTDAQRDAERAERKGAHDREQLAREIAIRTLALEDQLTMDLAAEMVRRQEILGNAAKITFGTMEEGFKRLDQLNLMLKVAGFEESLTPKVEQTAHVINDLAVPAIDTMAGSLERLSQKSAASAEAFSTPWIDALGIIKNEVEGQGTLFFELGQAWAEGGFAGVAALAKAKIKENIAYVIENLAKAVGSFALGNPASAALHLKSAAQHGAAAAAWGVAAKAAGGGGGGGAAGGSVGAGTGAKATTTQVAESEINIYLTGPGWNALNPEVQKVVRGAIDQARERYGENSKVRVQRAP